MKTPLPAIHNKVCIIIVPKNVTTKTAFSKNDVFVKVREGSVKASVKLKVQAFKNAVFVKVREGSVKVSVKLKVQAFKNAVSVKVREATVKEAVKAVKGESMDLQFSYYFFVFLL